MRGLMNVNELIAALQQIADAHPGRVIEIATTKSWPNPQPSHLTTRGSGDRYAVVIDFGKNGRPKWT